MTQPLPDLSGYSLDDLLAIREDVEAKINSRREDEMNKKIIDEVAKKGYSCQPDLDREIPSLTRMELPYLFCLESKDTRKVKVSQKEPFSQKDWVYVLQFTYSPSMFDDYEQISAWDYARLDDPYYADAMIKIPVYYQEKDLPPSGEFKMVFENGDVRTGRLRNNEIILFDDYDDDYYNCLSVVDNKLSRKAIILC